MRFSKSEGPAVIFSSNFVLMRESEHFIICPFFHSRMVQEAFERELRTLSLEKSIAISEPFDVQLRHRNPMVLFDWREWRLRDLDGEDGREWQRLFELPAIFVAVNVVEGEEKCLVSQQWRSKIRGLFFTTDGWQSFKRGIKVISQGEIWVPRKILLQWSVDEKQGDNGVNSGEVVNGNQLSSREKVVLASIASGKTNMEIAKELFISPNTVKAHLYKIYRKAGVSNRMQAVLWARKSGLVRQ